MLEAPQSGRTDASAVSEQDISAHLQRVLGSKQFTGSERLSSVLRFLVENSLAGQSERLKESVIAVEVFGRETSFDGNSDSIVRNAARRLRLKLAEYYAEEGSHDPIRIEIPKGGYAPVFRRHSESSVEASKLVPPERIPRPRLFYGIFAAAVCLLLLGGLWLSNGFINRSKASTGLTNPESIRLYSEAVERLNAFDPAAALSLLEKAVAIEPGSPLIHLKLSQVLEPLGYMVRARAEAATAFRLSSHLPRPEQIEAAGWYYQLSHDYPRALDAYSRLVKNYPDHHGYAIELAKLLASSGKIDDAIGVLDHAAKIGGGPPADLTLERSKTLAKRGAYESALPVAKQAAGEASAANLRPLYVNALLLERGLLLYLGRNQDADQVRRQAQSACAQLHDRGCLIHILRVDGNNALLAGDVPKAKAIYAQALELAQKMGDLAEQINLLNGMALIEIHDNHPERAAKTYDVVWRISDQSSDVRAFSDRAHGDLALFFGDVEGSIGFYRRASTEAQTAGDENAQSVILEDLGDALVLHGELSEAAKNFEQSAVLFHHLDLRPALARVDAKKSAVLVQLGQLAAAAQQQRAASREEGEAWNSSAQAHLAMANRFLAQGGAGEAVSEARTAAVLFEREGNNQDGEAEAYVLLLHALERTHKQQETQQAAEDLRALCRRQLSRVALIDAQLALAELPLTIGFDRTALVALENFASEAQRRGMALSSLQARLVLARAEITHRLPDGPLALARVTEQARQSGALLIAKEAAGVPVPEQKR